jgi:hypothetical protein
VKLDIEGDYLRVRLNPLEKILGFRRSFRLPSQNIASAFTDRPPWNLAQVRSPGAHLPFLLKAGTYYGGRRKEFWFATAFRPFLTIELRDWDYDRIVITTGENTAWARRINQMVEQTTSQWVANDSP